jgi:hypothetical protein
MDDHRPSAHVHNIHARHRETVGSVWTQTALSLEYPHFGAGVNSLRRGGKTPGSDRWNESAHFLAWDFGHRRRRHHGPRIHVHRRSLCTFETRAVSRCAVCCLWPRQCCGTDTGRLDHRSLVMALGVLGYRAYRCGRDFHDSRDGAEFTEERPARFNRLGGDRDVVRLARTVADGLRQRWKRQLAAGRPGH